MIADLPVRRFKIHLGVAEVIVSADHGACIKIFCGDALILHGFGNDKRGKAFAKTHDVVEGARSSFLYQEDAVQNIFELIHFYLYLRENTTLFLNAYKLAYSLQVAPLKQI